jgi:hypothetical protein
VPEHENLQLLRALRAAQQHDQRKHAAQRQLDERPQHARPPRERTADASLPPRASQDGRARQSFCTPRDSLQFRDPVSTELELTWHRSDV